jgi:hypothetical protein
MEEIFLWSGKELDTTLECEDDLWDKLEVTEKYLEEFRMAWKK